MIEVGDDGGGLNRERILQKADCAIARQFARRASVPCRSCDYQRAAAVAAARAPYGDRDAYRTAVRAQQQERARAIAEQYRAGLALAEIAAALDITPIAVQSAIYNARKAGLWPKTLRRGKDWRKGRKAA